jgi:hypothetical protein
MPIQVGTSTSWQSVSCGGYHSIALKTDGTLWSYGLNDNSQLGLGDYTQRNSPIQVGTDANWQKINGGLFFSLAIKTNGSIWSWGFNDFSQLGLGDSTDRSTPVQVACPAVLSSENFNTVNIVNIYPNPSTGIFTILSEEETAVEVYDMIGKKVYSNKVSIGSSTIDLTNHANGIYLVLVTNQTGNTNTFKLIKQ